MRTGLEIVRTDDYFGRSFRLREGIHVFYEYASLGESCENGSQRARSVSAFHTYNICKNDSDIRLAKHFHGLVHIGNYESQQTEVCGFSYTESVQIDAGIGEDFGYMVQPSAFVLKEDRYLLYCHL